MWTRERHRRFITLSLLSGWVGNDMKKNATGGMDVTCCASSVTSHNLEYISWNVEPQGNSMYFLHSPKQAKLPKLSHSLFLRNGRTLATALSGRKHGEGTLCEPNGRVYRGQWRDGKRHIEWNMVRWREDRQDSFSSVRVGENMYIIYVCNLCTTENGLLDL